MQNLASDRRQSSRSRARSNAGRPGINDFDKNMNTNAYVCGVQKAPRGAGEA